eukprot:SAG31_NODE_6299_length_2077_cov_1.366026_2_plen_93_part_00
MWSHHTFFRCWNCGRGSVGCCCDSSGEFNSSDLPAGVDPAGYPVQIAAMHALSGFFWVVQSGGSESRPQDEDAETRKQQLVALVECDLTIWP